MSTFHRLVLIGAGLAAPLSATLSATLSAADLGYSLIDVLSDSLLMHCGCTSIGIDTGWDVDHLGGERVKPWAISLRYDQLEQDQLLTGRKAVDIPAGSSAGIQHRTATLDADYQLTPAWSLGFSVPWVDRRQDDVFVDETDPTISTEDRNHGQGLGDIKAEARYIVSAGVSHRVGVIVGVKLPTGCTSKRTTVTTSESGTVTDVSDEPVTWTVNPGNGATDGIIGGLWRGEVLEHHQLDFFARIQAQFAATHHDEFRPGTRYSLNVGAHCQLHRYVSINLQATGLTSRRDTGERAENEESGGEFITISPGLAVYPMMDWQIFANYLLPAYSRVNGEQLVVTSGWSAGTAVRF